MLCLVHPSKSAADAPGAHTHFIPHMFPQMIPDSIACRLYVLIVLVETAVDLGIESDLLVRFHEAGKADDAPATGDADKPKKKKKKTTVSRSICHL